MFVLKAGAAGLNSLQQAGKIKSGEVVQIKVVRTLQGSSWQISVKGKLLAVSSEIPLKPGMHFTARAQYSSGQLMLKIIDQNPVSEFSGTSVLPDNDLTRIILESFARSSLPFSPEKAVFLYTFCKTHRLEEKSIIRLLTLFMDKGFPMRSDLLGDAVLLVQGKGEGEREGERKQRKEGNEKKKKSMINAIKSQVEEGDSGQGQLLQLFNHIRGDHDNWLVFPFQLETDRGTLSGCIRCKLRGRDKGASKKAGMLNNFSTVVLEVSDENTPLYFKLAEQNDGSPGLSIITNSSKNNGFPADVLNIFKEKLRNMGVSFDENVLDIGTFDGYDSGGSYIPVDAVV